MRSNPTGNDTLLRIQQEINEVAQRENEFRSTHSLNGIAVSNSSSSSPDLPTVPVLQRAVSTSALNGPATPVINGTSRRFIPNTNTKGVMQKFFKMRGKVATVATIATQPKPVIAWQSLDIVSKPPAKALIPADKPLRKGYVPIKERIQSELQELKSREEELRSERRKSQSDLMVYLEKKSENGNDENILSGDSRSPSPLLVVRKLRSARSLSYLLDEEEIGEETVSAPPSLRPARSLAQLCDAEEEEIESPRTLIQQWELRIRQSQENA